MQLPFNRAAARLLGAASLSLALVFSSACASAPVVPEKSMQDCIRNDKTGHPLLYAYEFPHLKIKTGDMPIFVKETPEEGFTVESPTVGTLIIKTPEDLEPENMTQEDLIAAAQALMPEYILPSERIDFETGLETFQETHDLSPEEVRIFWVPEARRLFVNIDRIIGKNPKSVQSPPLPAGKNTNIVTHFDERGFCTFELVLSP